MKPIAPCCIDLPALHLHGNSRVKFPFPLAIGQGITGVLRTIVTACCHSCFWSMVLLHGCTYHSIATFSLPTLLPNCMFLSHRPCNALFMAHARNRKTHHTTHPHTTTTHHMHPPCLTAHVFAIVVCVFLLAWVLLLSWAESSWSRLGCAMPGYARLAKASTG